MAEDLGEMDDLSRHLARPQGEIVFEVGQAAAPRSRPAGRCSDPMASGLPM